MKVLFVASGNSKSGVTPIVSNQGESLKKKGIDLDYFPIRGKGIFNYLKHVFLLKKYLEKNRYDIIHAHYGLCGLISHLARSKEKLVVSFMGDDLIGEINGKGKYSFVGNLYVLINKYFSRRFDYIITKSEQLDSILKKITDKAIIPNGVDTETFFEVSKHEARAVVRFEPEAKIIIFVSSPERKEKNYILASEAVNYLDDPAVKLVTVNSFENGKLKYIYNAADVLILTSYHEGSPNVIKEAMACNCPIVSTSVGDVKLVIGNSEGCYITSFDVIDITEKLRAALKYSQSKGRTKGRDRIFKLGLDSSSVADKIINIYKQII